MKTMRLTKRLQDGQHRGARAKVGIAGGRARVGQSLMARHECEK